ncbi:Ras GTPase-activating protein family - IQGAP [Trachipleistophora hominis]|uniref:Ras GTPase-activating protein family-IQGAP n=1 Tax=Trachipleistophora hominis TaxID=72359 RepID=L7JUG7_TRAHO|nr:Ras GTPase-activating protein family - IQGAP [Trachipleistophora hominis]
MAENLEIDLNDESKKPIRKNVHDRIEQGSVSASEMDENRKYEKEYEYLCYMAQARDWISKNIHLEMSNNLEFKEELRKGEILVDLANVISGKDMKAYRMNKLVYRHTDNHNAFIDFLREVKLNPCYHYGVLDAYDDVNIPSVIFCLHALSNHLQKFGYVNKIEKKRYVFTEKELSSARKEIKNFSALQFDSIGKDVKEMKKIIDEEYVPSPRRLSRLVNNLCRYRQYREKVNSTKSILKEQIESLNNTIPIVIVEFIKKKLKERISRRLSAKHDEVLRHTLRRFLMRNPMKEVLSGRASLFSIREVLRKQSMDIKYVIDAKHRLITEKLKENYDLETQIDKIMCTIEKVLDNTRLNIGLESSLYLTEYNKNFERILFYMQTEPKVLLDVLGKIDKDELEDFIARYIVPLFSTSSERDKYLILKIIDEDNSEVVSSSLYSEDNTEEDIRLVSYKIVVNLFRSSMMAVEIRDALLITDKVNVSNAKEDYIKSLNTIKDIVTRTMDTICSISMPYYVLYFFSKRGEGRRAADLRDFYNDFISPFIAAPDAFPNFRGKFDRNTLLTIDTVFQGILKGEFDNDYYLPLSSWGTDVRERLEAYFCENINRKTKITGNSKFRINKPMIQFSLKELNQLLGILQVITTKSVEFDNLIKRTRPYEYYDNEFVTLHLSNPVVKDDEDRFAGVVEDIADIVCVTRGRDLESILMSKSTKEEECRYKKLQNYKNNLIRTSTRECMEEYDNANNSDESEYDLLNKDSFVNDEERTESLDTSDSALLDELKVSVCKRIEVLEKNGVLTANKYDELVQKMCERIEEMRILMSQRRMEIKINNKTLSNLKKQNKFLRVRMDTVTEYFQSLLESYFVKGSGNCSKKSVYGTYKYKFKHLQKKNILMAVHDYTVDDPVVLYFSCDRPGVIDIHLVVGGQTVESVCITLEEILNKREEKSVVLGSLEFNSKGLLRLVNDNYVRR